MFKLLLKYHLKYEHKLIDKLHNLHQKVHLLHGRNIRQHISVYRVILYLQPMVKQVNVVLYLVLFIQYFLFLFSFAGEEIPCKLILTDCKLESVKDMFYFTYNSPFSYEESNPKRF